MIKTRNVLKSELKNIAKIFSINIYLKIITNYESGKTSHEDHIINKNFKSIKLLIMYDHYFLMECVNKSSLFRVVKSLSENIKKGLCLLNT